MSCESEYDGIDHCGPINFSRDDGLLRSLSHREPNYARYAIVKGEKSVERLVAFILPHQTVSYDLNGFSLRLTRNFTLFCHSRKT